MTKKILVSLLAVGFILVFAVSSMAAIGGTVALGVEAQTAVATITYSTAFEDVSFSLAWSDDLTSPGFGTISPTLTAGPLKIASVYNIDTSIADTSATLSWTAWSGFVTFTVGWNLNTQLFATTILFTF